MTDPRTTARRAAIPQKISYPEDLPISAWREELLDAIGTNQVVIVAGETGSGKSTQLPKLCLELGRGVAGRIGHTQPRRIAARSIAERVAEELGSDLGDLVGYTVRFTDEVADATAIKVMTDGILLNEIQRDRTLRQYDTIIIDEAHERSLNIDFLLGYLKQLLPRRPDLKLIITSATIDTERFAQHFADAPVVEVEGRTYPVEVRYRPLIDPTSGEARDQSQAICDAVAELAAEGTGDVLVFCSGEREIRDAVDALRGLDFRHTEILPLFGRLSAAEQHRIFSGHTGRRIVVSTNVAETSLTVPGIRFVVDSGFARISRYSKRTKVQQLPIEPISQASARQRAGRCGRLGPGIAVRLYDEDDHDGRPEYTDPEILRTNLASVMLQMSNIGLGRVDEFPFIDPPDTRSIKDGIALLHELGAITAGSEGTREWLTDVGRKLARIPTDPRLGRMLIAAHENAALDEVLTIVAAMAIQDPRERPTGKEQQADQRHAAFKDESSDFLSWLKLWDFVSSERQKRTSNQFRRMCREEFLSWRRVREWQDLRAQLRRVTRDMRMRPNRRKATPELIHQSLLAGLLSHVGRRDPDGWEYRGARGSRFSIRPGSTLFRKGPEWVMAGELVETTRTWATDVVAVDPTVVERVADHLVRRTLSDPWWSKDRAAAVARETVTLYGLPLSTDRVVQYERFDPTVSRELFIRHALVAGEWETHHAFARSNADAIDAVLEVEERERRSDLLVTDEALVAHFDALIPDSVTSRQAFDRWWRDEKGRNPHLLDLTADELVNPEAAAIDEEAFPRVWSYGDVDLHLTYEFDPGSETDGVTVDVPLGMLDRIDPAAFEWNVPGLRAELVTGLIRSLPKHLRKQFAPVPDTAAEVAPAIAEADGTLVEALARELTRRTGTVIRPDDFDADRVPTHVRPRFRVLDDEGGTVAEGDNLAAIRSELQSAAREVVAASSHPIERTGITTWDFGDLPDEVSIGEGAGAVMAYPALIDEGESVAIRLLATPDERDAETWLGLRRLLILALPSPRQLLRAVLADHQPLPIVGSPYASTDAWMDDVLVCALDEVMARTGGLVWTTEGFDRLLGEVKAGLADSLESVGSAAARSMHSLQALNIAISDTRDDVFGDVLDDIDQQLDRFLFDGYLAAVGSERVDDVRRYLDGAAYRLRKLPDDPARDRDRMAIINGLEDELDDLSEVLTVTPALVEVAWMIQELRMSLFAQPIGVRGTISEKRVRLALRALLG